MTSPGHAPATHDPHHRPTLLIAGLGLLGGSIALAARRRGLAGHIIGVGRRDLSPAVDAGVIDEASADLATAAPRADIIILCTPVDIIRRQLAVVREAARPDALVTDVGSTKRRIAQQAAEVFGNGVPAFVGSHPMVGGHQTGWEAATADLFRGGVVYVTPREAHDLDPAARIGHFWQGLGARLVYIHPDRHDQLCGLLSHLPHLAAVALTRQLQQSREDVNLLRVLAGNGLRDTTRIAMGSADVWREIFAHNSDTVAAQARALATALNTMADELDASRMDEFQKLLAETSDFRHRLQL